MFVPYEVLCRFLINERYVFAWSKPPRLYVTSQRSYSRSARTTLRSVAAGPADTICGWDQWTLAPTKKSYVLSQRRRLGSLISILIAPLFVKISYSLIACSVY